MSAVPQEDRPAVVLRETEARQAGNVRTRWAWTEPAVWTDRMLTALERGVKGGVWFSLIDKVYDLDNLWAAFAKVKANGGAAGCDHQTIAMYESDLEANLEDLSDQLRTQRYRPQRIKRVQIPKPGSTETRPLGIPTVRDRIVQTALRNVIESIFERDFAEHSYGFRPNRTYGSEGGEIGQPIFPTPIFRLPLRGCASAIVYQSRTRTPGKCRRHCR